MTEGTKSYLIGCHQFFFHPLFVLIAWIKTYHSFPKLWEIVCIFLHDIGHIGTQYLTDKNQKWEHWRTGALIAYRFFGPKGWLMVAGHCPEQSNQPESKLSYPDKLSWLIAPMWWLWCNYWVEWSHSGHKITPPPEWKKLVKDNLKSDNPLGNHELYLKHRH